jgi:hypothetical protein
MTELIEADADPYDWRRFVQYGDGATPSTIEMRERAAKEYADALRKSQPAAVVWSDFEDYATQCLRHTELDVEAAIKLLLRWATEQAPVKAALDVFVLEALHAHLGRCEGCGQPLVTMPAPNPKLWHSDACRKRASRSK